MISNQQPIGPVLCRYELKFIISESLIEPLSEFASIYCSPDRYSLSSSDSFYTVNSLYFDTYHFLFLRRRLHDEDHRFNMRVRTYDDNPASPHFLEIKYKTGSILKKIRGRIDGADWPAAIEDPAYEPDPDLGIQNAESVCKFTRLALIYNIEPKVLIQYKRKAFISDCDDYARVTFDKELKCMQPRGLHDTQDSKELNYLDHEMTFPNKGNVVLELKCYTDKVPLWIIDMIRTFDLHRGSFSKYVSGVMETSGYIGYDPGIRSSVLF